MPGKGGKGSINVKKTAILFATGYEEVEALTVVDLLRRAKIGCDIVAVDDGDFVTGSHGIAIRADLGFTQTDFDACDGVILPGGLKGTNHLKKDPRVIALLQRFHEEGKLTAAICAAPTVLAEAGILEGKHAVCYPGLEGELTGAIPMAAPSVPDENVITGRALGSAIPFALEIIRYFEGEEAAAAVAKGIVY